MGESGIIKSNNDEMAVADVHYIGKLDKSIYSCVTEDIATDEVIITDERIEHINERHPGNFELLIPYLQDAVAMPDFILEDKSRANTALVLKQVITDDIKFQVVLRLHTSADDRKFKNSIISAWQISDARWNNYLKNRKILYKSE